MNNTMFLKPIGYKMQRDSNLELYRIICMIMIVAHHYLVNSGLKSTGGPMTTDFTSANSIFMTFFGAWGKTGINCFLMITGYFMCSSKITLRKFIKLMGQVYLYKILIYPIFLIAGYESLTVFRLIKLLMPTWGISDDFTGCFICFWLTIPFFNILVHNMNKRQHRILLFLLLMLYTLLGSIPTFNVSFNYITWFGIIYLIASYIRMYPNPLFNRRKLWGWLTFASILGAMMSIIVLLKLSAGARFFFVSDSNKFFAVAVAVCSFLWFKNLNIKYNKLINVFGAGTFGVLLIHANSDAMRSWLWKDTIDVVGHYTTMDTSFFVLFSFFVVLSIFVICNLIDQLRIYTIEKWMFQYYDDKLASKANAWINKLTSNN